jgi:hypothetical protein
MSLTVRDAEEYYNKLQEWIPMYSDTDLVKFWGHVIGYDMFKISEKELNCKDCKVYYGPLIAPENRAWTISLFLMSWILYNLKRKTENGHCNNINHAHKKKDPRNCDRGRAFHSKKYSECLKSFKDIINSFEKNPPKTFPLTKSDSQSVNYYIDSD